MSFWELSALHKDNNKGQEETQPPMFAPVPDPRVVLL